MRRFAGEGRLRSLLAMERGTVRTNAILFLVGTAVYAASQWLLVLLFAWAGGPDAVGLFTMAAAISTPLIVLSQLSLRQVLIADVEGRHPFADHLQLRLLLTVVAVLATLGVAAALGYAGWALLAIMGFATGRAVESVSDIYYGRMQSRERLDLVAGFLVLRATATVAASAGALIATGSLAWSSAAFAGASLLCQFIVRRVEGAGPEAASPLRRPFPSALVRHAAPLATAQFVVALTTHVPRFVLQHLGGTSLVGQAAVVDVLLTIGLLGVAAIGQACSSPLAKAFGRGDLSGFLRLARTAVLAAAALGGVTALGGAAIGREVVILLYGPAFTTAADACATLALCAAPGYVASMLGWVLTATGRFKNMAGASLAGLGVTALGSYVGVRLFGLPGLGVASAASGLLFVMAYAYLIRVAMRSVGSAQLGQAEA